jgi:hypothetical protein
MPILVQVIDPTCVEGRGSSDEAVDLIPHLEKKLGEIGTVLMVIPGIRARFMCLLPPAPSLVSDLGKTRSFLSQYEAKVVEPHRGPIVPASARKPVEV